MQRLEQRIQPEVINMWNTFGIDFATNNLRAIEKIQHKYRQGGIIREKALHDILGYLDPVFEANTDILRKGQKTKVKETFGITPTIPIGTTSYAGDELVEPIASYIPNAMGFVTIAYGLYEGIAISFEENLTAEKIKPAVEAVLDQPELNLDIVDLLFGKEQIPVSTFFSQDDFEKIIRNSISKTIIEFDEMVKKKDYQKPEKIKLFVSGFQGANTKYCMDVVKKTIKEFEEKAGYKIETDLDNIGNFVGWIYGGFNGGEFQEPQPYSIGDKSE